MNTTNNSIYLAYSQDAVRRLPAVIAQWLSEAGYDVFMGITNYWRSDPLPETVLTEIHNRPIYLVVLTPGSAPWVFNPDEARLSPDIEYALETDRIFIVVCAYDLEPARTRRWPPFPENVQIIQLNHLNFTDGIGQILDLIDPASFDRYAIPPLPDTLERQLHAEAALDRGLVEVSDALANNRVPNTIIHFNEAIDLDPDFADAYYHRAEFKYLKSRDITWLEDAIQDYTHAIRLNPEEARYYGARGKAYKKRKLLDAALADYTSAIELAPHTAQYYSSRASLSSYTEMMRLLRIIQRLFNTDPINLTTIRHAAIFMLNAKHISLH
jgi:tetratricopeptide (TPR) repeat protein